MTKERRLTYKQQLFVENYTTNGGNGLDAARQAEYKGDDNVLGVTAFDNLRKPNIKAAINAKMAILAAKSEHNWQIAVDKLNALLAALAPMVEKGNIAAINAATGVMRELDAITGLQRTTVITEKKEPELDEGEKRALEPIARDFKLRLAERKVG